MTTNSNVWLLAVVVAGALVSAQSLAEDKVQGIPYSHTQYLPDCAGPCSVYYPQVPAGKILVIQHMTGLVWMSNPGSTNPFIAAELMATDTGDPSVRTGHYLEMKGHPLPAGNEYLGSSPMLAFVAAGKVPQVQMVGGIGVFFMRITISGYLLSAL